MFIFKTMAYRNKMSKISFSLLLLAIIFTSCKQGGSGKLSISGSLSASGDTTPIYLNTHYSFRERAADLVSKMTLSEEIGQFRTNHAPAIPRLGVQAYYYWNESQHGVNTLGGNLHHGKIGGGPHATSFPANMATAMTWDPELIYKEGIAISDEARGFLDKSLWNQGQNNLGSSPKNYGCLTFWAPTVNMDRDPRWGRTNEAFGEDPFLASKMAEGYVNGLQGQTMTGRSITGYLKIAATAKHYALNNFEVVRERSSSNASDRAIRDYYTKVFRNLIEKAHVSGLMTALNAVNGTPSIVNSYLVNELARRTYGFDGYTTSDCEDLINIFYGNNDNVHPKGHAWAPPGWEINNPGENATWTNKQTGKKIPAVVGALAYAIRVGAELNCKGTQYTFSNVSKAVKAGLLNRGMIDRALARVFTIRMRTGEFDPPGKVRYTRITKSVIEDSAHQRLAEKVAENALVLLKNIPMTTIKINAEEHKMAQCLLPLNVSKMKKIVIVGNLANKVTLGGYSGAPTLQVSAVQGIKTALKKLNPKATVDFYSAGTSTSSNRPAVLSAKAKADIKSASMVIVFTGTNWSNVHEGFDRHSLAMPGNYDSMIKQVAALGNPNMVLVIQSDGPITLSKIQNKFSSILFSAYNGESQGTALAKVLFGQKDPCGHLNFTWYKDESQLPNMLNYELTPDKTKGLGRTYMYFAGHPTFPFGYGLSYSRFSYSHFKVSTNQASPNDSVTVSFDVTNTGEFSGATVAQLYVAYPRIKGKELPIKKLEGFQKTKTLKPGETEHISLTVKLSKLALWNEQELKAIVYNGVYQFQVGYSSYNIVNSTNVDIHGSLTPKILYVTVMPPKLVYYVGDTLNLKGKNKWMTSDINQNIAQPHARADNIVEAVRNNGSFVDLSRKRIKYSSNNKQVVTVNAKGVVTANNSGVATITATVNGISGSTVIVVKKQKG